MNVDHFYFWVSGSGVFITSISGSRSYRNKEGNWNQNLQFPVLPFDLSHLESKSHANFGHFLRLQITLNQAKTCLN